MAKITDNINSYQEYVRIKTDYARKAKAIALDSETPRRLRDMNVNLCVASGILVYLMRAGEEGAEAVRSVEPWTPAIISPWFAMLEASGRIHEKLYNLYADADGELKPHREFFKERIGELMRACVSLLSELDIPASEVLEIDIARVIKEHEKVNAEANRKGAE